MSVVENPPLTERAPRSRQQSLAVGSVLGALYVLAGLWVVFAGLPVFWTEVLRVQDVTNDFLSGALLMMLCALALVGLGYVGYQIIRNQTQKGLRAGIFFTAVGIFAALWIGGTIANLMEHRSFEAAPGFGAGLVLAGLLVGLLVFFLLQPGFTRMLEAVEDQGWFHGTSFKPSQGIRVRRGTVVGVLVLGVCGIITMVSHRAFGVERPELPPNDWYWSVPFTSQTVAAEDVVAEVKGARSLDEARAIIAELVGQRDAFTGLTENADWQSTLADTVRQQLSGLEVTASRYLPLMFKVHLIMPVVLGLLLIWFAWRLVNVPAFADFLIATEAEMNKVSWTTRRRLIQDTIVVLVTVFLLTGFLFAVDVLWIKVLSNEYVGVLIYNPRDVQQKQQEKSQW